MNEQKIADAEVENELSNRQLARRHFRDFISYTFGEDYIFGKWHEKLFDAFEKVENGTLKRLIVQLPPRVGKTEICSKRFPVRFLGKNPTKKVICACYGSELSSKNSREARGIVLGEKFRNLFPNFHLSDEKRESANWETSEGGGYYSVGIGGALTGFGGDLMIIDDYCKNREDAESPTIREKTWDWYTSTFYTRKQNADAAIVILATRWHNDDLLGRLLRSNGDQWEVISFPALSVIEGNETSFFPERFSSEYYQNERENIGVRDFAALYQQDPILSMGGDFKKEMFRYYALSDLDATKDQYSVGVVCDPAFSTHKSADSLVVTVIARHRKTGEMYELDKIGGNFPPSVGSRLPVSMAMRWKSAGWNVDFIAVEDVSINRQQQIFVQQVDEEMRRQQCFVTLKRYTPKAKKEDRIRYRLEPYFSRGAWFFRSDDSGNDAWRKAEEEYLRFPTGDHDDYPDCAAIAVEVFEELSLSRNDIILEKQKSYVEELLRNSV